MYELGRSAAQSQVGTNNALALLGPKAQQATVHSNPMSLELGGQSTCSHVLCSLDILQFVSKRNQIIAIVAAVLAVLLVVGGGFYFARLKGTPNSGPQPTAPASSAISQSASPSTLTCTTTTEGFVPVRYTIEGSMDVDEKVLSLGQDDEGNIAAPPPSENRAASWWNEGPQPGTEGKTVLSIHTYRNGKALGNEMYKDGQSQLQPGDTIKLYGDKGEVACYKFTEAKKIGVEEYDPDSDMMVDFEGDPELAIIICWDFDAKAEDAGQEAWKSRVFFYGDLF